MIDPVITGTAVMKNICPIFTNAKNVNCKFLIRIFLLCNAFKPIWTVLFGKFLIYSLFSKGVWIKELAVNENSDFPAPLSNSKHFIFEILLYFQIWRNKDLVLVKFCKFLIIFFHNCFFFAAMRIDKMDKIESIVPNCPSGLCISKQDFLKPDFSVDNFFIEQSVKDTPLDTLRDDLGIYLKVNSFWQSIPSGSGYIFGRIRVHIRPDPGTYSAGSGCIFGRIRVHIRPDPGAYSAGSGYIFGRIRVHSTYFGLCC